MNINPLQRNLQKEVIDTIKNSSDQDNMEKKVKETISKTIQEFKKDLKDKDSTSENQAIKILEVKGLITSRILKEELEKLKNEIKDYIRLKTNNR